MLISPLQKYTPKDWSGLTTENHMGALFQQEPQLVSNVIENIFSVNLGDDLLSFINRFPTEYIDDDRPYEWLLQGSDEKNIPLLDYWKDTTAAAKPTSPGVGHSRFVMVFPERLFAPTDVIVGDRPDLYSLRIVAETMAGTTQMCTVELVTGDANLFIPAEELTSSTRWSKDYSLVEQTLSKRGGSTSHTSPFRMQNILSMIRKEYKVPGNMIRKGANKPLAFSWKDESGKVQTQWIKKLDWDFMVQFRKETARLLAYGRSNKSDSGTYGNRGDSGYEIRSGAGLYEQIAPANIFYYNTFSLDWLTEVAMGLSVGKLPEDSRNLVLSTGEYGMYQFHKAAEAKSSSWTPNFSQDRISISGNKMTYSGQFLEYRTVNGITFTLMHDPMKDDPIRNKLYHPDGGLAESYKMDILDFGTANGEANIKKVAIKGDEEIFKYIPGMRDPYSPYNKTTSPTMASTSVDGYEVHKMFIGGLKITNPMRTASLRPQILA